MTINTVQNAITAKQTTKIGIFGGSRDLFHFLKKNQNTTPIRTSTDDLLKSAYRMLEQAEHNLQERDQRISALENIVTTDELTRLANRRGFYASFKGELDRASRGDNQGGILIMIDLDHFKTINDTFGHLAGDEALKIVGAFLLSTIRDMDVAARIGGDEFIVLFSNTSIFHAMQRIKILGEELNNLTFEWQGKTIKIQASLGLKEYKQGDTINHIIKGADKHMYQDKESKRITRH
ncbi:MAG: GGDEF domain-containing protein [Zetaproteobacteria bacterium]|nr:MAG: GGDEF domain-containing protein [Zetaproteobacteria bacterium]